MSTGYSDSESLPDGIFFLLGALRGSLLPVPLHIRASGLLFFLSLSAVYVLTTGPSLFKKNKIKAVRFLLFVCV